MTNPQEAVFTNNAYMRELTALPGDIPRVFIEQAQEAANLLEMLDQGIHTPETEKLLIALSNASFVGTYKARYAEEYETSFPGWLKRGHEQAKSTRPNMVTKTAAREYSSYWSSHGGTKDKKVDGEMDYGDYIHYKEGVPPPAKTLLATFKAYMPGNIEPGDIARILEGLSVHSAHPHMTKLPPDASRIVLYWITAERENVRAQLAALGIPWIRQDSFRIDESGKLKVTVSGDKALSAESQATDFRQKSYDKAKFFKHYLQLCYYWARNPADPNWVSFVPSSVELTAVSNEIKQEAAQVGIPIVYNPPRKIENF